MENLTLFSSITALIAGLPIITEFIKSVLKIKNGTISQILSWIIGILACVFGKYFELGFLVDLTWIKVILTGIGVSLAANGVFDIKIIKTVLQIIFKKLK